MRAIVNVDLRNHGNHFMPGVEYFPLVNEKGETIGKATREECHSGGKLLHPVVHLHLFNRAGELYLQKRSMRKDIQPGKWDTAVGGHVNYGEAVEAALRREAGEELGITGFTPVFVTRYIFESAIEKEMVYVFMTLYEGPLTPDPGELDGGRFWTIEEIESHIGKNLFTPNFENEFRQEFDYICRQIHTYPYGNNDES
jgi:isopentenyldiphosphate isomerase